MAQQLARRDEQLAGSCNAQLPLKPQNSYQQLQHAAVPVNGGRRRRQSSSLCWDGHEPSQSLACGQLELELQDKVATITPLVRGTQAARPVCCKVTVKV